MSQLVDVLLVIAFLLTALAGVKNGFFRELFSGVGLILGVLAGMHFTQSLVEWIGIGFLQNELGVTILFAAIFIAVFAVTVLGGGLLAVVWEGKSPTAASRMAGFALGALRGLLLVTVLAGAILLLAPSGGGSLVRSHVLPTLEPGVRMGAKLLPDDVEKQVLQRWDDIDFRHDAQPSLQI